MRPACMRPGMSHERKRRPAMTCAQHVETMATAGAGRRRAAACGRAAAGGAAGAVRFLLAGARRRRQRLRQVRRLLPRQLPAASAGGPQRRILVVSCGAGLSGRPAAAGGLSATSVGIDSDPAKIAHANGGAACRARPAEAFAFLEHNREPFDVIIPEQELNHLTLDEQIEFLALCRRNLKPGGLHHRLWAERRQSAGRLRKPRPQYRSFQHLHRLQSEAGAAARRLRATSRSCRSSSTCSGRTR